MTAYHVLFPDRPGDSMAVDGDDLTLTTNGSWALITDTNGIALAIAAGPGITIQRIDPDDTGQTTEDGPAPEG